MNKDRRFGKRIAEPSSVQIIHELKLMALRQSPDPAVTRDADGTSTSGTAAASAPAASLSVPT